MKIYRIDTDKYDETPGPMIDPKELKLLSELRPWRGLAQIALEWIAIFAAIAICEAHWHPLLYILTVAWIGARQNGLAVMMHESVHYRLLPNRKWNDWIGEVFTAWPVLVTANGFRQTHFAHHRHVNKPEDPDWVRKQNKLFDYPKPLHEIISITLKYWSGFYILKELIGINQESKVPSSLQRLRLAFYAAAVILSIVFGFWEGLLIYWVVPLCTYFLWIIYVRGVAEHFAGIEHHESLLEKTRHIEANLFERIMLAPNYIHVHIAHHLYPSVPFYNLKRLHDTLMRHPEYAGKAHITKGYLALLRECARRKVS